MNAAINTITTLMFLMIWLVHISSMIESGMTKKGWFNSIAFGVIIIWRIWA